MKYLCTLFDYNYLPLGLALYKSIRRNFPDFHLWILAMDSKAFHFLQKESLENVTIISLDDIEDEEVLIAKGNRTWQEYCWTLSPVLPSYILDENPEIDHITYLDSDIYFFSDVQPIYEEIGNHSIMIIPHRFPKRLDHLKANGVYNVQMVYFKRDELGMSCLSRWKSQCLEWCYNKVEEDRLGDQKYLDRWPETYENVCVLNNEQAGVALWNIEQYEVRVEDSKIYINGKPLIFYHFHLFKLFSNFIYGTGVSDYSLDYSKIRKIYDEYLGELFEVVTHFDLKLRRLGVKGIFKFMERNDFYSFNYFLGTFWKISLFGFLLGKRILIFGRNYFRKTLFLF
ncbi:glycosyl transferase [Leptospira stimsonii]|uniref:Glycosyl transferase n=1 Tax=Leptospira stimsonii TaxID=2202203 RepID=A0A396ZCM2_9LEPT|nr:glycosyl transferase [Leptospira stimsonii]RHX90850.1 glycosyl transferase [Leptospira stimsonii]